MDGSAIACSLSWMGMYVVDKLDDSPLTEADIKVNEFLRLNLLVLLNGTKEFAQVIPEFSISADLVFDQQVVTEGVMNPANGEGRIRFDQRSS